MDISQEMAIFTDVESNRLLVSIAKVSLFFGSLWLVFYCAHRRLPYIKNGHVIIYEAKTNEMCRSIELPSHARYTIVACGDSKILSGFIPRVFDSADPNVVSYNFGLPNTEQFLFLLEHLIQRGQIPTHVFLTAGWPKDARKNRLFALPGDAQIMKTLFPFRKLPRDVSLFLLGSRSRGGIRAFYRYGKESVETMLANRGYYFIEGQSHFPNHRLPDGFSLQIDTPDQTYRRRFDTGHPTFTKLMELHRNYHMNFYIVPTYYRIGSRAPSPQTNENAEVFKGCPGIRVLGPEYFLFPNQSFSDPIHLNPEGAEQYTKILRQLFEENIMKSSHGLALDSPRSRVAER